VIGVSVLPLALDIALVADFDDAAADGGFGLVSPIVERAAFVLEFGCGLVGQISLLVVAVRSQSAQGIA